MIKKINEYFRKALAKFKSFKATLPERITILRCKVWHQIYLIRKNAVQFARIYWRYIAVAMGLPCFVASFYFCDEWQRLIFDYFKLADSKDTDNFMFIMTTLSSIGICLIGVSVMAFTLAMFSIQQSSEKLPHKFFQQIQKNSSVIFLFFLLFLIALFISILPTCAQPNNIAFFLLTQFWLIVIYLTLIAYTYSRAMKLISPIENLDVLVSSLEQKFKFWQTYFNRIVSKEAYSIIDTQPNNEIKQPQVYLQRMSQITKGLEHLFYIAQRYARWGDFDISNYALNNTLIKMNKLYIQVKAGAFYTDTILAKHPLSTDEYLNSCLGKLSQTLESALARNEDELAIQVLRSLNQLVGCYSDIEYQNYHRKSKPYAYIAMFYLCQGVTLAFTQKRSDVVLNGVRLIGATTQTLLEKSNLYNTEKGIEVICEISIESLAFKERLPVVQEGVIQLLSLSRSLIECKHRDIQYSVRSIKDRLAALIIGIMAHTEKSMHKVLLASYFSLSDPNSLIHFVNTLSQRLKTEKDQKKLKDAMYNISLWLQEEHYKHEVVLISEAIKAKSSATVGIIAWIVNLFKVLVEISEIKLDEFYPIQPTLKNQAIGLIQVIFSNISITRENAHFLEQASLTMFLVDMGLYSHKRKNIFEAIQYVSLFWGIRSLTSEVLIKVLYSLIAINLESWDEDTGNKIKNKLRESLIRYKKDWELTGLQNAAKIMDACSYDTVLGEFSMTPVGQKLNRIIKSKLPQANVISRELSKCIFDTLNEKDPQEVE